VPPRVATNGFATVYIIVPPGTFHEEYTHVTKLLARRAVGQADRKKGILSEVPEVLYLLGQARFAARVQAFDYRDVLACAYPDRESKALVSNAVFSIPYTTDVRSRTVVPQPVAEGKIRFLTHLRVRRTVYSIDPVHAETLIVERLRELAFALDASATIEAGLGWADFIISGAVPPAKFNDFLAALVDFNRVTIDPKVGGSDCVFKRSLTLIGYPWGEELAPPVIDTAMTALMFIRARPGRLSQVEALVKKAFSRKDAETDVAFVDGKIDVIATMRSGKRPDFFEQHEMLSEKTGPDAIEKFETHVVFGHDLFSDLDEIHDESSIKPHDCGCAKRIPRAEVVEVVPDPLANAIKNIEFLFSSTIRDPANCCDARSAIQACEKSLRRLLVTNLTSKLGIDRARLDDEQSHQAAVLREHGTIMQTLRRVERWVLMSERILRQRTVGSFEEFLGQSDRAVSYRGGAQKVLTVADNLMNDFYAKLVGLDEPEPYLTSLYDSVDRIQHVVGTGLVCMPVRALFYLPGVLPDLWHEVGGFYFFQTIRHEELGLDPTDPVQDVIYRDLADHYGDLVSFLYGFGLDFEQFTTAMIEGWLAAPPYTNPPALVHELSYIHIVARIVAIREFLIMITDPDGVAAVGRKNLLYVLYDEVCELIRRYVSSRVPESTPLIKGKVLAILCSGSDSSNRLFNGLTFLREKLDKDDIEDALTALANRPSSTRYNFTDPAPLREFKESDDMNEEFRKLYWAVMRERRDEGERPHAFSQTASITRGAALEYHRRAARRSGA